MRKRNQMKKGIAALLSGVLAFGMTAGVIPEFGDSMRSVRAATGIAPSVTAYATKQQMMEGTFVTRNDTGTAANVGVLAFGENRANKTQEWYILGKDKYVDGDNTVIFTVQDGIIPLTRPNDAQKYSTTTNDRAYKDSYGTYPTGKEPTTVPCNHYGASTLRAELNKIASDTTCFSKAQQKLLNTTKITTTYRLDRMDYTYTNSDKLYAPVFNPSHEQILRIGSQDQIRISTLVYWDSEEKPTWTRSAIENQEDRVYAVSKTLIWKGYPNDEQLRKAVSAASNLDLTDVLFASSAEAATSGTTVSGEIAQGKAMTLRLNGDGKDIGTVTCNADAGQINAKKGNTTGNVALVVQGNDGTKDWYYSKQISGTDNVIVNASDIAAESNTPSDIDLTNCKIWLEVTEDSVAYAVEATTTTDVVKTNISSVEITGIDTPVSNTALDTSAVCATQGVSTTAPAVTWTPNDTTAGYNTTYTASVTLEASANYKFTDSVRVTINGNNASVTKNEDGTLTVTYTFPATAKDKLTSITAPGAVTVANGTAYTDMNLPTQVNIVTEGNTVDKADVTWDTASGNYDPSVLTEQVVTLNGTVTCPENIDTNGVALTTNIKITVSAAGIVGAPTPLVESGTYTENQTVALKSSTDGATIYYTTNGVEPGRTTGTRYTGPLTATGMEGQSITTTIKAIAVKDGMQDSEVKTFTYTIEIPKPIVKHTITATAGANGSISPSGKVEVVEGADQTFSITANDGYEIESLKVDGAAVSTAPSYTFTNVRAAHTIEATFKQKITVEKPSIGKQPQNASVKAGEQATFTVAATGTDLKYQWQINRNDGNGFADIAGADRASYTTSAVDKNCNGYKYQCVISNSAGSVTTNAATLTVTEDVTPPAVTKHIITATAGANGSISPSGEVKVTEGADQTFSIKANDGYEIASLKVDGKTVSTAASYTFKNVTEAHTIEVTFKQKATPVQPTVKKPGISKQPQNVSVKAGEQATFTVKATGTDLTYQWQINRNNGKGFVDITGADKASYTTGVVDMLCNGYKYQCVISNSAGSVTTNAATLTVTESTTPSPDPVSYKILDGANSSWTENTDGSLTIRGNGEMEKFQNVKVDGKIIDKKNYTVTKGSTIITLKADYLKTLATGDHTFEIVWTDGSATTKFTVAKNNQTTQNNPTDTKKKEQSVTAPKTGDTSDMTLWTTLLIVSFAGAAGIVVRRNNKTCK